MARDRKGKKGQGEETVVSKCGDDIQNPSLDIGYQVDDHAVGKDKMSKKLKKTRAGNEGVDSAPTQRESKYHSKEHVADLKKKKSIKKGRPSSNGDGESDKSVSDTKDINEYVKYEVISNHEQCSGKTDSNLRKNHGKLEYDTVFNKSALKSRFQFTGAESDTIDFNSEVSKEMKKSGNECLTTSMIEQEKTESKAPKKSKKKERRKKNADDEDIEKLLEELSLEMTGHHHTENPVENEVQNKDTKPTKKKSRKEVDGSKIESSEDKEHSLSILAEEQQHTVKSAAQKRKEKKEKERQKKSATYGQKQSSRSMMNTESVPAKEDCVVATPEIEISEVYDEQKDDDVSKKKKKGEEEKKKDKRPGKKRIAAMQEALKKVREEEERLKREEEAKIKAEEEAERLRQEKLRLEQERKEKKKQKEKEKRERLKAEGKLLSKSQKQNRARMEATLAALREQGVVVPQIGEKRERVPRLGDRKRILKKKNDSQISLCENENVEFPDEGKDSSPEVGTDFNDDTKLSLGVEEVVSVKEAWDESTDEDSESSKNENMGKNSAESTTESDCDSESESDVTDSDVDSTDSESDNKRNEDSLSLKVKEKIKKRRDDNESNRSASKLRSPVVCVLGHVDTGKTKILDKIRRTHVQDSEAGGITQQIGATMVPQEALKEQCKMVKSFTEMDLKIPGLLIIDTPGHESFSNLRSRGSSLCDIAVLVVDIMHGIEPQTLESINLLKQKKTPFIVALNKIDRLYEWKPFKSKDIADVIKNQARNTKMEFEDRTKDIVLQFANQGLNAVICYDNSDPRSYISMVPTSAVTGDGMGNLMALVVQLTQQMMAKRLSFSEELQATVLEVKAIPGLGTTIDAILVNGRLREGDTIVLAGYEGPVVTQIRSLLMPQPLKELRVKNPYQEYKEVEGAQGVKITGKELDKVIAGLQLLIAHCAEEVPVLKDEVISSFHEAMNHIKLAERGVYVQASTLGSLEALLDFLKSSRIPYAGIRIGPVVKKDVMKASIMLEHDSQYAVILAFDVKVERDAQELADNLGVKIFQADIIYHLFDKFMAFREDLKNKKRDELKSIAIFPCKLRILPQHIFNSRDPIVVGVIVEAGVVKEGTPLCVPSKEFLEIGTVATIEVNHKAIENARKGQEVCIKIEPAGGEAPKMYGRHFEHTDILVSKITRQSIDVCKEFFRDDLLKSDWQLMVELKKIFQIL